MALHPWLAFDPAMTVSRIREGLVTALRGSLRRKGFVVAVSGGIDSSVCAALAAEAAGRKNVLALILPERDSSPESGDRARILCGHLGIAFEVQDIAPTLEAIGCYRWRDEAIRTVVPGYGTGSGWKSKIVIDPGLLDADRFNFFRLVAEDPHGAVVEKRLPLAPYLQIVAATNFKQRIRKTLEYFHADRLNYAVVGTPNRLEHDQGFFVKNGDGSADVKPIAHLYKSQVYELASWLGLPETIRKAAPTTDTYSLPQGQDEFYFVLPYPSMDLALWGLDHGKGEDEVGRELGLTAEQVHRVYEDIRRKRTATRPLHLRPVLVEPVPSVG